jgi:hypothetical protein
MAEFQDPFDPLATSGADFSLKKLLQYPPETLARMDAEKETFDDLMQQRRFGEAASATPTLNRILGESMFGAGIIKKFTPRVIQGGFAGRTDAQKFALTAEKQRVREQTLSEIFKARRAKEAHLRKPTREQLSELPKEEQDRILKAFDEGRIEEVKLPIGNVPAEIEAVKRLSPTKEGQQKILDIFAGLPISKRKKMLSNLLNLKLANPDKDIAKLFSPPRPIKPPK